MFNDNITVQDSYVGKLLVAMPGLSDANFSNSVIFITKHNSDETTGLIINKQHSEITFSKMLKRHGVTKSDPRFDKYVNLGGPVNQSQGFILHSTDYMIEGRSNRIGDEYALTSARKILLDIAMGFGPKSEMFIIGNSVWSKGQLEKEIANNGWLICEPTPETVFGTNVQEKWHATLIANGIVPSQLAMMNISGQA